MSDRPLAVTNSTLSIFIAELNRECLKVQPLVNQLQLPSLTPKQQAEILAELLAVRWAVRMSTKLTLEREFHLHKNDLVQHQQY